MFTRPLVASAALTLSLSLFACGAAEEPFVDDASEGASVPQESVASTAEALSTGWMLTWVDNFSGSSLDRDNWQPMTLPAGAFNGEYQRYVDEEGPNGTFEVVNGELVVRMRYDGGGFGGYKSARLVTKNKVEKSQGAWEARLWFWKSQSAAGLWPAFWLLGHRLNQEPLLHSDETVCWPMYGGNEVDVFEFVSNTNENQGNLIKDWGGGCEVYDTRNFKTPYSGVNAYAPHVYRVEWKDDVVRLVVDGVTYRTLGASEWRNVWDNKFYAILNVAIAGTLGGNHAFGPSDYAGMTVDYVRHYTWNDDAPTFPDANKSYKLKTLWDNYVLTGKDASGDNTRPTMVIDGNWSSQRWRFVDAGGGYYYVKNDWSGKYLVMKDEYDNHNSPAFNVTADSFTGVGSQKFKLNVDANGKYVIEGYYGVGLTSVQANNDSSRNFRRAAGRWPDATKASHRWIMSASQ